jgi:hypothetical protein
MYGYYKCAEKNEKVMSDLNLVEFDDESIDSIVRKVVEYFLYDESSTQSIIEIF